MSANIVVSPRDKGWAECRWASLIDVDGIKAFGPDFDSDHAPGEAWWAILVDGEEAGMGWVRRFTKSGRVMNQGIAISSEWRGRGIIYGARAALKDAILEKYPVARTIILICYNTNALALGYLERHDGQPGHCTSLGVIPDGDVAMHVFLVGSRA